MPRDLLTRPMEIAATVNPVTLRDGGDALARPAGHGWETIGIGSLVVGVAGVGVVALSVRVIRRHD